MKKVLSILLGSVLAFSLSFGCVCALEAASSILNGTYTLVVDEYDWGVATPKAIVKLEKPISTIDKDALKVVETKETTDPTTPVQTDRTVIDAYLSNQNGQKVEGESTYFTVELKVSPNEGSPFIYKSFNEWANPYYLTISLKENKKLSCGDVTYDALNIDTTYTSRSLSAGDQFDYTGKYKASDGVEYSYATYSPEEDNHKNALVIWLNGGGEGGTNPQIAVLGNKVTGLIGEKTQKSLDNAYVFVPQCPSLWMDGYGDFEFTPSGLNFTPSHTPSKFVKSLMECIQSYVNSNSDIDTDRIYIGGCSNGGYMTMQMVLSYTDYFTAAFPICTGFDATDLSEADAARIKDFPLFITYCENDDTLNPDQFSRPLIKKLKAAGATNLHVFSPDDVHDTTGLYKDEEGNPYQYSTHWSWIYVLNNEAIEDNGTLELFTWLGQQTKKKEASSGSTASKDEDKTSVKTGDDTAITASITLLTFAGAGYTYLKIKKESI